MLAYLETWVVEDGQLPPVAVGDVLSDVGIWARCWSMQPSQGRDEVVALTPHAASDFLAGYELDGTMAWRREEPEGGVLASNGGLVVVQGPWIQTGEVDFRLVRLGLPAVGQRARVQGTCWLMPRHEHNPDRPMLPMRGAPDVRASWAVNGLGVAHREADPENKSKARHVVSPLQRMSIPKDTENQGCYLLDLTRLR